MSGKRKAAAPAIAIVRIIVRVPLETPRKLKREKMKLAAIETAMSSASVLSPRAGGTGRPLADVGGALSRVVSGGVHGRRLRHCLAADSCRLGKERSAL